MLLNLLQLLNTNYLNEVYIAHLNQVNVGAKDEPVGH